MIPYIFCLWKWSLTFFVCDSDPLILILRYSDPLHFFFVTVIPYILILRYSDPLQFTYNHLVYRGQRHSERYASAV